MELREAKRVWSEDHYQPLGLTAPQVEAVVAETLAAVQPNRAGRQAPRAFYFRQQEASGRWLTRGLGRHPASGDFLVHDLPFLDNPTDFYGRSETVYLPALYSPATARSLVEQIFSDDQPQLKPLTDLPGPLRQPDRGQAPYRELTADLRAGIDQTRSRLDSLGCRLPEQTTNPAEALNPKDLYWLERESGRPAVEAKTPAEPDPWAGLLIIELLESAEEIYTIDQIGQAINANRHQPLEPTQIRSLLAKLNQQSKIQSVSQGHYAAQTLDLSSFAAHQLPGPVTDRILALIATSPKQEWSGQAVADGLNQTNNRFAPDLVEPQTAQDRLQYLNQLGKIKRVGRGIYSSLDHPRPKHQTQAPITAQQISELINQNPQQSFNKAEIATGLDPDGSKERRIKQIGNHLPELLRQGKIKRIAFGIYASPNHPQNPREWPIASIAGRVLAVINSQPDQAWDPPAICRAANADPDAPPLKPKQVHSTLNYLAGRSGQIKQVGPGRFASLNSGWDKQQRQPPAAERLFALLSQQPGDLSPKQAADRLNQASKRPITARYASKCLRQLVEAGRVRLTSYGRYAVEPTPKPTPKKRPRPVENNDDLRPPPPPKNGGRVSLGRRVGQMTRIWDGPATPQEIADAIEDDAPESFDRQTVEELAESALRRQGKLTAPTAKN